MHPDDGDAVHRFGLTGSRMESRYVRYWVLRHADRDADHLAATLADALSLSRKQKRGLVLPEWPLPRASVTPPRKPARPRGRSPRAARPLPSAACSRNSSCPARCAASVTASRNPGSQAGPMVRPRGSNRPGVADQIGSASDGVLPACFQAQAARTSAAVLSRSARTNPRPCSDHACAAWAARSRAGTVGAPNGLWHGGPASRPEPRWRRPTARTGLRRLRPRLGLAAGSAPGGSSPVSSGLSIQGWQNQGLFCFEQCNQNRAQSAC